MAKAKKQEATDAGSKPQAAKPAAKAPAPKAAAPKPAGAKPAAKKSPKSAKPAAPSGTPMIDTSLAAAAAANMVRNRNLLNDAGQEGKKQETAAFRQMKENLNKPSGAGSAGLQQDAGLHKKSSQPFGGFKQVGRNQTFGADVNRAGVPRRTGG